MSLRLENNNSYINRHQKEKIIKKNNSILVYGEYVDIDRALNFLINQMHIDRTKIEKCPSIL